jgi:hypothetical protein
MSPPRNWDFPNTSPASNTKGKGIVGNLYIFLLKHRLFGSTMNKTETQRKISYWEKCSMFLFSATLQLLKSLYFLLKSVDNFYYWIANRLGAKDLFDIPGGTRARLLDERFSTSQPSSVLL